MNFIQKALFTEEGLNLTNIFLMLLSLLLSFWVPFHLFLMVYAILGPLHYLTEISWLDKKNFFISDKKDVWLFVVFAFLMSIGVFNSTSKVNNLFSAFMITSLLYAVVLLVVKQKALKYGIGLAIFLVAYSLKLNNKEFSLLWFGVMMPTILHVFLFTGIFMLYGALKSRSKIGILSVVCLILCALFCFLIPAETSSVPGTGEFLRKNLLNFQITNKSLLYLFGLENLNDFKSVFSYPYENLFTTPGAIQVARFIAFAYTYHYLNWFSKTSVIKWHEAPKKRMLIILALWVISVILYFVNYRIGFMALFFLSVLHVLLEFPLNVISFRGVFGELKTINLKK